MKETSFVFEELRVVNYVEHQLLMESKSVYKDWQSESLVMLRYITQSSANNLILGDAQVCKLFMKIRKNKGPRTLPWGTPHETGEEEGR